MAAWLSDVPDDHASGAGSFVAVMASPSDHNAAPSRTTSFIKNCPTAPERAGTPPRLGSHPGVENNVVTNIRTATALPIVHALADQCRRLIKLAIHNSTMQCQTITEYQ